MLVEGEVVADGQKPATNSRGTWQLVEGDGMMSGYGGECFVIDCRLLGRLESLGGDSAIKSV